MIALASSSTHATNGMALSGYGPISMSLGGAATAYDNGNFGAINNPATLALMEEGRRVEIGANLMNVAAGARIPGGPEADSSASWFLMPSLSYMVKTEDWAYGVGLFTQGGMGMDYGNNSFLSIDPNSAQPTGLPDESEVMVGRLILPVAFNATDRLTLGGSLDVVYASLTMKQLLPQQALIDMLTPGQQTLGVAGVDPQTAEGLANANYAHFDLEKLDNWGFGGQIGLTFRATDALTLGASYQFETSMGDLEGDGRIKAGVGSMYQTISGKARIKDAQWPATIKLGAAWQASQRLLLVADIKRYNWSDVLESLKIRFTPDSGGFVNVDMYQKWKDQTVYSIGAEYVLNPKVKLRGGFNYGANPIPDKYLQHLGGAITEKHLMLGAGIKLGKSGQLDLAYAHTFENTATNSNPLVGLSSSLSQNSFNLNYAHHF